MVPASFARKAKAGVVILRGKNLWLAPTLGAEARVGQRHAETVPSGLAADLRHFGADRVCAWIGQR